MFNKSAANLVDNLHNVKFCLKIGKTILTNVNFFDADTHKI